jgi:hypothetical protein
MNHTVKKMTLPMKRFDLTKIARDAVVLILGQRNSGKSQLVKDLMYRNRDIPNGVVISGTEHVSPFFGHFFPDTFIYNRYSSEIVGSVLKKQIAKKKRSGEGKHPENNTFLLMDDCVAQASAWRKDENLTEVFVNGRHYQIMLCMTTQYPMAIPPLQRGQADYVFIYKEDNFSTRKKLHEFYAGVIPSFQLFDQMMRVICKDWTCLVIDIRNKHANHWTERVFYYKARQHGDFRFGNEDFWSYHERHIKDKEGKDEDSALIEAQKLVEDYSNRQIYKIIKQEYEYEDEE